MHMTYLFHFQHESGRIGFEIVIYTDPGENLIGDAKRGVLSRYAGALVKQRKGFWCNKKNILHHVLLHIER